MSKQIRRTGVLQHAKKTSGLISSFHVAKKTKTRGVEHCKIPCERGEVSSCGVTTYLVKQASKKFKSRRAPAATDRYYLKHRHFLHVITRAITTSLSGGSVTCRWEGGIARSSDYHVMKDSPPPSARRVASPTLFTVLYYTSCR